MEWDRFASIFGQLGGALTALHSKNILHRDVKPENVLLDNEGTVTLIDLSIGTEIAYLGELTRQDQILGTVDYMAPEQRHGLRIDARTDEYSLAAMAFEMLTGYCPLGQFRKPSELNPYLPAAVSEALLKGLERDPEERFSSVESFVDALLEAGRQGCSRRTIPRATFEVAAIFAALTGCIVMYLNSPKSASSDGRLAVTTTLRFEDAAIDNGHQVMTNSLGMKLVWIAAGSFQMGASRDELVQQFRTQCAGPHHVRSPEALSEIEAAILDGGVRSIGRAVSRLRGRDGVQDDERTVDVRIREIADATALE